jgi:C4-dicarboxylate-specific signal transduction histidine kinase
LGTLPDHGHFRRATAWRSWSDPSAQCLQSSRRYSSPWKWAALHAIYIAAACVASIVAWRKTEDAVEAVRVTNNQLEQEVERRRTAEQALQQAHAELERKVQERTADLQNANEALVLETVERRRAEELLRQALLELHEKQAQVLQSAKLASLGELASGVAHELNNPLNNIGLFVGNVLDSLKENTVDHEQATTQLQETLHQVRKAGTIIKELRTFSRTAHSQKEPVQVNQVVDSALMLLQEQLRLQNIKVETHLPEQSVVVGNGIQLEQVLINLLSNAKDALEGVEEKRLTIRSVRDGSWVELTVQDTGCGIAPDIVTRIFDPFFTTKALGKGTGLGLSISYGIIKEHGGTITVESSPGKGTCFIVRLPFAERTAQQPVEC